MLRIEIINIMRYKVDEKCFSNVSYAIELLIILHQIKKYIYETLNLQTQYLKKNISRIDDYVSTYYRMVYKFCIL